MSIYSKQLVAMQRLTTVRTPLYTVPAGKIAVVKELQFFCVAVGATPNFSLQIHNTPLPNIDVMSFTPTALQQFFAQCRLVLEVGDQLLLRATPAGTLINFGASGYELAA